MSLWNGSTSALCAFFCYPLAEWFQVDLCQELFEEIVLKQVTVVMEALETSPDLCRESGQVLPGPPIPTLFSVELPGLYSALQATYHSISSKNLPDSGMLLRES